MASDRKMHRRPRSATSRAWLFCGLLVLPGLVAAGVLLHQNHMGTAPTVAIGACLLLYLVLIAAAMVDTWVRPLQTLSNVVASLREGDYSFRARGASAPDALGELASEINLLADLLQRQRVRSLEATALLARILEVMHAPLFAFDRENTLQLVNDAGLKLLGLPHARSFGRTAAELGMEFLLHAPDQSTHTIRFGQKQQAAQTSWLLRRASFRQEGAPHTILLLADVSVPLREEEQIAWKRLIRVLGHELSNSLAPIKSIAGSLRMRVDTLHADSDTLNDFRRGLGVVEGRADALHRFVQSYRKLAQLPPPALRPFEFAPMIERIAALEQRLRVEVEPGPEIVLNADPDQLEQMLINLLGNAVDASLGKDGCPVRIGWKLAGNSVLITIEDRGLGIANTENLFVPFYTTKPTGSGVGLVLAQQIARAHGGEIQLANREDGEGARASIRLPLSIGKGE
jgi:Signal transduction histidine kinase involved in nitrogen fixation and metabolism regulation